MQPNYSHSALDAAVLKVGAVWLHLHCSQLAHSTRPAVALLKEFQIYSCPYPRTLPEACPTSQKWPVQWKSQYYNTGLSLLLTPCSFCQTVSQLMEIKEQHLSKSGSFKEFCQVTNSTRRGYTWNNFSIRKVTDGSRCQNAFYTERENIRQGLFHNIF